MKIILYFMIINFYLINCLHLTNNQMQQITNLIKNPTLNSNQREKINYILYKSYEKWAVKKAIDFKNIHQVTCKNINKNELILSSKYGLFKSIKKYNGACPFIYFSEFYVKSELFKLLTSHYSFSSIPKNIRIKSKLNFTEQELLDYNNKLEPILLNYSENDVFDISYTSKQEHILDKIQIYEANAEIWEKINKFEPFSKRIIYLKYDREFNKIRSNKLVGELMCCSEENIRKTLHDAFKKMANIE